MRGFWVLLIAALVAGCTIVDDTQATTGAGQAAGVETPPPPPATVAPGPLTDGALASPQTVEVPAEPGDDGPPPTGDEPEAD